MSPLRVWIDHEQAPACKPGAHVKLSADESAHVVRSLRARRGDAVVLLDGEGLVVEGKLASADGDGAMVEVIRARTADPLSPAIYVAQGMPKGGTMDDLVRICCEAGAAGVIPLETARCEVKLDADRARTRRERWQQQAVEACKQSGHPWRAEISARHGWPDCLQASTACCCQRSRRVRARSASSFTSQRAVSSGMTPAAPASQQMRTKSSIVPPLGMPWAT